MKKSSSVFTAILILLILTISCKTNEKEPKQEKETETKIQKPNILLIVADDMGFSDIAPFGGEINTPTLSKLANEGLMLTNFHVLPTCSPSRSVLLSGTDNHMAGLGSMEELKTPKQHGKPGYEGYLNNRVSHLPQILKDAGYQTYMSGKWHLGFEKEHWPSKKGFAETFSLLPGGGSHWADRIPLSPPQIMNYVRNGELVDELPVDFYSTKNYTDYILEWLERDKNDEKPFFAYVSYTASHDPLHAPKEYIDKYKGKYNQGFEVLREKRYEQLKKLGIIPETTTIPAWPGKKWDDLSEEEKKESARDMEVYAAMIDYMDEQILRILNWLDQNNELDNTMVVFFSDNGANGAMSTAYPGQTEAFLNSIDNSLENRGLPNSFVEMGPEWATASMSPHRLYKAFTTEGGIISPCIVKLPATINDSLEMNKAFTHISDIMPTLLELADTEHPSINNDSIPEMIGKSLIPLLNGEKETIHSGEGIGYELHGMRAYIKEEWKIVNLPMPFGTGDWELFNLAEDPSESKDLSKEYPEIRKELIAAWEAYSKNVGVVYDPLDFKEMLKHD